MLSSKLHKFLKVVYPSAKHTVIVNDDDDYVILEYLCIDVFNYAFASVLMRDLPTNRSSHQILNFPRTPGIFFSPVDIANIRDVV